jgi:hypothetical protein
MNALLSDGWQRLGTSSLRKRLGLTAALAIAILSAGEQLVRSDESALARTRPFAICHNQIYGLCATARCFVFNKISYCTCDVKSGDSISLRHKYDAGDVCTVNAGGPNGGYMVSTYSLPPSIVAPSGNQALYTCTARTSTGAYAQCDGGICSKSTSGGVFPGSSMRVGEGQIVCACPITVAQPGAGTLGYQMIGPYPCQSSFFDYCDSATANTNDGSTIYSGATTGGIRLFTLLLYGSVPAFNRCEQAPK